MNLWKKRPRVSSELIAGTKPSEDGKALRCSFCNKTQEDVKKLIAGPNVFICDECVETCREIIAGGGGGSVSVRWNDFE
jgi:hypothetical protein